MEVTVKFQGALGSNLPGYDSGKAIQVELPSGATVHDLFVCLKIVEPRKTIVTMDYQVLKAEEKLREGADLKIFQMVSGG